MGFKEQEWSKFKRTNGLKFELVVRDQDFKKLDTVKFCSNNFIKTVSDIGNRYGIKGNFLSKDNLDNEIDWLRKSNII